MNISGLIIKKIQQQKNDKVPHGSRLCSSRSQVNYHQLVSWAATPASSRNTEECAAKEKKFSAQFIFYCMNVAPAQALSYATMHAESTLLWPRPAWRWWWWGGQRQQRRQRGMIWRKLNTFRCIIINNLFNIFSTTVTLFLYILDWRCLVHRLLVVWTLVMDCRTSFIKSSPTFCFFIFDSTIVKWQWLSWATIDDFFLPLNQRNSHFVNMLLKMQLFLSVFWPWQLWENNLKSEGSFLLHWCHIVLQDSLHRPSVNWSSLTDSLTVMFCSRVIAFWLSCYAEAAAFLLSPQP